MTLFGWFLIGHLIGDWLLQSDWMANGKRRRLVTAAGLSHFFVYTLTLASMVWLYHHKHPIPPNKFLSMALLIFISHWLIDATYFVEKWMKLLGQRNQPLVRLMVDQSFHLIILGIVAQSIP